MDILESAIHLYGPGHSNAHYIRRLASDLHASEDAVCSWWYGRRNMRASTKELLRRRVEDTKPVDFMGD